MLALCSLFISFEIIDAFLTMWAVQHGFTEVNLLMAPIAGTWLGPLVKIVPTLAAAGLLLWVTRRWPHTRPVAGFGLVAACGFMAIIIGSNLLEL
jgi:hypothetical protein